MKKLRHGATNCDLSLSLPDPPAPNRPSAVHSYLRLDAEVAALWKRQKVEMPVERLQRGNAVVPSREGRPVLLPPVGRPSSSPTSPLPDSDIRYPFNPLCLPVDPRHPALPSKQLSRTLIRA